MRSHQTKLNFFLFLLLLAISNVSFAKTWIVQVGGTSSQGDGYGGGYTNPILAFDPALLTINAGDTVTFSNLGGAPHNVHADDNSFRCANGCDDSGGDGTPSSADWSFSRTFATAGTVSYHCDQHVSMGMTGQIIVNAVTPPPPSIALGGYLSGNWYNSEQSGHGFQLEFTNANNNMVAIWFVYTPDGTGQNWIYAQGPYDPTSNTVTLNAILLTGAKFPPLFVSSDLTNTPWGTLTFTFSDCNNGTASWAPTLASYTPSSAPLAITRLTQIAGTTCP